MINRRNAHHTSPESAQIPSDAVYRIGSRLTVHNGVIDWPKFFEEVAQHALEQAPHFIPVLLPGGVVRDTEYVVRNPNRLDKSLGSFSINLKTGKWCDFAICRGGRDLLSLYAYVNRIENMGNACRKLANELGVGMPTPVPSINPPLPIVVPKAWPKPVLPVPEYAPVLPPRPGEESRWYYLDERSQVLLVRVRTPDPVREKRVITWTWCEQSPGQFEWHPKSPLTPWPLYGLDKLALYPDRPVIITEGEKAADAAQLIFPAWVSVTSGSAKSCWSADWRSLIGRDIVIWPDADDPGLAYALQVAKRLTGIAKSIRIVALPTEIMAWRKTTADKAGGWDLADVPPLGVDLNNLLASAKRIDMEIPDSGGPNGME